MKTLLIKSRLGVDLLNMQITLDDRSYTVCGLAKAERIDGQLWQWWIIIEDK